MAEAVGAEGGEEEMGGGGGGRSGGENREIHRIGFRFLFAGESRRRVFFDFFLLGLLERRDSQAEGMR